MSEESLKKKTIKGIVWSGIDNVAQHCVTFIVGIILARLLSPDDYGLLGIVSIFIAICNTLINGGLSNAIIRKKAPTDDDYDTVFIVNLGMSFFLYVVIFLCAPSISNFFRREELIGLIRVSSIGMIIGALAMVQQAKLTKQVDFKPQAKITFVGSIVSGLIGISMAILDYGVWALVIQQLSNCFLRTILLWKNNKWFPRFHFSTDSFHNLFGFGWKLAISGLIDTLWNELYQVVVGKYYSPATLGQFTRAKSFSQLFSSNLTSVVQRVTYPVLSNIQDDRNRMVVAYRKIIKMTMFVSSISMFAIGAISEPLLYCLIGHQWNEASMYLPLICISASLYPLHSINLNMLNVQGRSDLFLGLEIIKKTIAVGPLLVGVFVGIIPMLCISLITSVIAFFLNSHYSGKLIGYSSWMQIKDVAPSYGIAMLIALCVFFLKYLPVSFWIVLPLQLLVVALVFFVICHVLKCVEYVELKGIIGGYL